MSIHTKGKACYTRWCCYVHVIRYFKHRGRVSVGTESQKQKNPYIIIALWCVRCRTIPSGEIWTSRIKYFIALIHVWRLKFLCTRKKESTYYTMCKLQRKLPNYFSFAIRTNLLKYIINIGQRRLGKGRVWILKWGALFISQCQDLKMFSVM